MSDRMAKRRRAEERATNDALDEKSKAFTLALLRAFQSRFRDRAREFYDEFPEAYRPCGTCAMNPSTNDWQGQERTALNFVTTLIRNRPFYCHDGAPQDETGWHVDPEVAPLCAGWAIVYGDEALAIDAAREAYESIGVNFSRDARGDVMIRRMLAELADLTIAMEREDMLPR